MKKTIKIWLSRILGLFLLSTVLTLGAAVLNFEAFKEYSITHEISFAETFIYSTLYMFCCTSIGLLIGAMSFYLLVIFPKKISHEESTK